MREKTAVVLAQLTEELRARKTEVLQEFHIEITETSMKPL